MDGKVRVWSRPDRERFAWPACSLDLNPIGHLWDQLEIAVRTGHHRHPLQDLRQIVVDEWNAIPQQRVQRLISNMRRRYEAVVAVFGGSNPLLT